MLWREHGGTASTPICSSMGSARAVPYGVTSAASSTPTAMANGWSSNFRGTGGPTRCRSTASARSRRPWRRNSSRIVRIGSSGIRSARTSVSRLRAAGSVCARTLLARVKALLRRAGIEAGGAMAAGELALDLEAHSVAADPDRERRSRRGHGATVDACLGPSRQRRPAAPEAARAPAPAEDRDRSRRAALPANRAWRRLPPGGLMRPGAPSPPAALQP